MFASKAHGGSQDVSFEINRADPTFKDPLVSRPLESGGGNRLLARASYYFQLTAGHRLPKRAEIQRQASIEVLVRLRPLFGARKRSASSRDQVQAAGLVR